MKKALLIFISTFVVLTALSAVFMEEELTAEQFGFVGDLKSVRVEIARLGAQLLVSEPETLSFSESGLLIASERSSMKIIYVYDEFDRLVRKEFIDDEGEVFQTVEVIYDDEFYEAIAFDGTGNELERTRYWLDLVERTLSFSISTETGSSTNTLYFDDSGRKTKSYSIVRESVEDLGTDVNIVVESRFTYDLNGFLKSETTIVRIRKEGMEHSTEYRTRVDILLRDENGNPARELRRTEFQDGSNPPEEFIYSREFIYY